MRARTPRAFRPSLSASGTLERRDVPTAVPTYAPPPTGGATAAPVYVAPPRADRPLAPPPLLRLAAADPPPAPGRPNGDLVPVEITGVGTINLRVTPGGQVGAFAVELELVLTNHQHLEALVGTVTIHGVSPQGRPLPPYVVPVYALPGSVDYRFFSETFHYPVGTAVGVTYFGFATASDGSVYAMGTGDFFVVK